MIFENCIEPGLPGFYLDYDDKNKAVCNTRQLFLKIASESFYNPENRGS